MSETENSQHGAKLLVSCSAYLVAIKSGKEIEQRIVVAKDVFDV